MNKSVLKNGDLLFMSDESDFSKAIIETTDKFSHVGIYFDHMIYHASRKLGVAKQNLDEYLKEEKREVFIFRYPQIDAEILPIFDIVPMKFGDGEKEVSDYWKKYYEDLGVPVPLNKPGTNPSQIAKSEKLKYIGKLDY